MLSEFKFFIALTQGIRRKRNDLFAIFCVIIGSHALIDNNLSNKGRISLLKRDKHPKAAERRLCTRYDGRCTTRTTAVSADGQRACAARRANRQWGAGESIWEVPARCAGILRSRSGRDVVKPCAEFRTPFVIALLVRLC